MAYPRNTNSKSQFPNAESKEMHTIAECLSKCKACAKKCMEEGNTHLACSCLDCSEVCDLAMKLKSTDSEYCQQALDLCAQACRTCANECERHPSQHSQECADACRRCAESCTSSSATPSSATPSYR